MTSNVLKNVTIGFGAFALCDQLETLHFPQTLRSIGPFAFHEDHSLAEATLPEGFNTLDEAAFQFCTGLRHVSLPSTLDSVGGWAFYGCASLDTIIYPDVLHRIGRVAMENCSSLTYCYLPEQLEYMDEWLLYGTAMSSFEVPPHVTHIDMGALAGCRQLHRVTLPASLTALGDSIFIDGTPLDTLVLLCSIPPSINESVFPEYTAALIVPCGSAPAYRQHTIWGRFEDITEDCTGIDELERADVPVRITVRDGRIIVDGAEGEPVNVYDMMGRPVSNQALPTGVYLVKVGDRSAQKVMLLP